MRSGGVITWLRRAVIASGFLCTVWAVGPSGVAEAHRALRRDAAPAAEIRALWVTRSSLTTPLGITALVKTARDQGFNTLLVQVRGRGDAYFASELEPRPADLSRQPASFDPLAAVLAEA